MSALVTVETKLFNFILLPHARLLRSFCYGWDTTIYFAIPTSGLTANRTSTFLKDPSFLNYASYGIIDYLYRQFTSKNLQITKLVTLRVEQNIDEQTTQVKVVWLIRYQHRVQCTQVPIICGTYKTVVTSDYQRTKCLA